MSEINSAEIKVSLDATGVETGLRKIDDATARTGRNVDNLGQASGFQQLGAGADVAGTKVDRATKNLAESIQRATAAMQSGTKGSAEYFAALANSRGANLATLKPYLDQLDEVTKKTVLAAEAQKRLDAGSSFLENLRGRTEAIGKTASELAELRAQELGVADAARPMIEQMRAAEEAAGGAEEGFGKYSRGLVALGTITAGAAAGFALVTAGVTDSIGALADLDDVAQKTGSSVENLSKLQRVAQVVGQDFGAVDAAIAKLAKGMGGLDDDSNKVNAALRRIGVSSKDAAGALRDPSEVLIEAARNLQNYADDAGKTALINDLLGKSGADLLPYLNDVSESIDDFSGASAAAAKDAAALQDSIGFLKVRTQEFYTDIAQRVVPAMSDLVGAFGDAAREQDKLVGSEVTDWANDLAIGLARVADVAVLIPRLLSGVYGSFQAVGADIAYMAKAAEAGNPFVALGKWAQGGSAVADLEKALAERNKVVDASNKKLSDLWNKPVDGIEQALMKRLNDRVAMFQDPLGDKFMEAVSNYGRIRLNPPKDDEGANDRAAAIERQADAYRALVAAINDRVAATAREAAGLDPLTESQKLEARLTNEIAAGKVRITEAAEQELRSRLALLRADEVAVAMQKRVEQGNVERARAAKQRSDESAKSIADAVREAERNEDLARTFGMTRKEIESVTLARLEEQLAQKTSTGLYNEEIEALEQVIAAKRRSVAALGSVESQDAAKRANEALAADWKRTMDNIDDVFRQGFADMLNNGKDGWKSFTKSLTTTFKTSVADAIYKMFAQPFVARVVASVTGFTGTSGLAQAAGVPGVGGSGGVGDVGSIASAAQAAYKAISGGFQGISTAVADGVQAAMYGTGMTNQIASNGAFAQGVGSLGGIAAGYFAGDALNKAISDGYETGSGVMKAEKVATAIASAFNPALGALVGAVNGLRNRAFGMKPRENTGTTLNGMFDADGFEGTTDTAWKQKGGWFRSDKSGVDKVAIDAIVASQFTAGYEALKKSSADFASVLGINADAIKNRTQALSIALTGDQAKDQEAIAKFFIGVGDQIAVELVPTIAQFAKAATEFGGVGESASATLQRIAGNYAFIDAALASIGDTFGAVGLGSVAARERLLELTGGLDAFGKGSAFFAQTFLTEAERLEPVRKSVTDTLAGLGLAMVDSRDEFKAVVLGLDLTTEAGAKTYASLMGVQEQFAALYPAVESTADALKAAAEAAKEQRQSLQDQLDELTMTPAQKLAKARAEVAPANVDLFDQIQAVQAGKAAAEAAKAAADALASANQAYQDQIDSLLKSQMGAAELRAFETKGMDASTVALYDRLAALKYEVEASKAASDAVIAAAKARADAIQSFGDGLAATMNNAKKAAQELRDFNASLVLGNLSALDPDEKYREAKRQFEASSPTDTAAAQAFLEASKGRDADSAYYQRDFAAVQARLAAAAAGRDSFAASIPAFWQTYLASQSQPAVPAPAVMRSLVPAAPTASAASQQSTAALEKKLDQLGERLEKALAPIADSTTTTADIQKQLLAEAP